MDYPDAESVVKDRLQHLARYIKQQLPIKDWGFILLAFPFGPKGDCLYVANARREDALQAMREFISKNSKETFGTDQGTMGEEGFDLWWKGQIARYPGSEQMSEQYKGWCQDAFMAGMIWQPAE